jgi:hypothetical protein
MKPRRKDTKSRPPCQRKKGVKGEKSRREKGEGGKEKKRPFNLSLQPSSITNLEKAANHLGISRSEVIDQATQGEIDLLDLLRQLDLVSSEGESFDPGSSR